MFKVWRSEWSRTRQSETLDQTTAAPHAPKPETLNFMRTKALLASLLELSLGLLPEAFIVHPVGVDRIGPLPVTEEVSDLVKNLTVGLQHVWLHQKPR